MYEQIDRGNEKSWVRSDLKGRQKEFCMCWDCTGFKSETEDKGCGIIREVLQLASARKIVLPVWECARFTRKNH